MLLEQLDWKKIREKSEYGIFSMVIEKMQREEEEKRRQTEWEKEMSV
jgi:hypothetical protein